ncbi:hypothetical protein K8R33_03440, partial [archaeon]|nr:hypothetical protein [archaeon]
VSTHQLRAGPSIRDEKVLYPYLEIAKRVTKKARLPCLAVSGITLTSALLNYFGVDDPDLSKVIEFGVRSLSYFGLASAMYLNDRDPKVLEKNSLLSRAYNWLTDRLTPEPVPVPVRNYSVLEDSLG